MKNLLKIHVKVFRIILLLFILIWGGLASWGLLCSEQYITAFLVLLLSVILIIIALLIAKTILCNQIEKIIVLDEMIQFVLMDGKSKIVEKKAIKRIKLIDGKYTFYFENHEKLYYTVSISPLVIFKKPNADPLINASNFPFSIIE